MKVGPITANLRMQDVSFGDLDCTCGDEPPGAHAFSWQDATGPVSKHQGHAGRRNTCYSKRSCTWQAPAVPSVAAVVQLPAPQHSDCPAA